MQRLCAYFVYAIFTLSGTGLPAESGEPQRKETWTREMLKTLASPRDKEEHAKEEQLMAFHEMKEENERLKNQLHSFEKEIRQLLDEAGREKITTVTPTDLFYTDTKAYLTARTNRYGKIRTVLKSSGEVIQEMESEEPSRDHKFVFDNLRDETDYEMEIVALFGGQEMEDTRISADEFPDQLRFKTHEKEPDPYISLERFDATDGVPDSVGIIFFVNQESYVIIECRYQEETGEVVVWYDCPPEGEFSTNEAGKPSGNRAPFTKGYGRIDMTSLQSDTLYEFTPVAYSKYGKVSQKISNKYRTKKFERLEFAGPVELKIAPGTLSVSWTATVSPEKSKVELFHESLGEVHSKTPEIQGTQLSASIEIPQSDDAKHAEIPTIAVSMEKQGERVIREFKFGFVMPDEEQSQKLSRKQRKALENLLESIESPGQKRLAWKDMADLGFSLALAFL